MIITNEITKNTRLSKTISIKESLLLLISISLFTYLLFPFHFNHYYTFPNQIEKVTTISILSAILLFPTGIYRFLYQKEINASDVLILVYGIYMLACCKLPLDYEWTFQLFISISIYLFFRTQSGSNCISLLYILPLAGIVQILSEIDRLSIPGHKLSHFTGSFYNTGLFGGFIALCLVTAIGLFIHTKSGKWYLNKGLLFMLSIPLFIQMIASGSRASWVAFFTSLIFTLIIHFRQNTNKHRKNIVYSGIGCVFLIAIFSFQYLYHWKKDSADGRLLIWTVSGNMIKESPINGNGIHSFRANYMDHQADYFMKHPQSEFQLLADDILHPFNEYLKIFIEQGIAGLLLFLSIIFILLYHNKSRNTSGKEIGTNTIAKTILVFLLTFACFSYPSEQLPFHIIFSI